MFADSSGDDNSEFDNVKPAIVVTVAPDVIAVEPFYDNVLRINKAVRVEGIGEEMVGRIHGAAGILVLQPGAAGGRVLLQDGEGDAHLL